MVQVDTFSRLNLCGDASAMHDMHVVRYRGLTQSEPTTLPRASGVGNGMMLTLFVVGLVGSVLG
jgi:hypothetical protein